MKIKKPIIVGGVILIILAIAFKFFGHFIWPGLEGRDPGKPSDQIMFQLNDKRATYEIVKGSAGAYMVRYSVSSYGQAVGVTALIGSSEVDLESFLNKLVKIDGKYRKKFGRALCWDYVKCVENKLDQESFTVIDIKKIKTP